MAGRISLLTEALCSPRHTLPEVSYEELRGIRDDLRELATFTVARPRGDATLTTSRNALAHCFDHFADRIENVLATCDEVMQQS